MRFMQTAKQHLGKRAKERISSDRKDAMSPQAA
jgi:hypothetical protein